MLSHATFLLSFAVEEPGEWCNRVPGLLRIHISGIKRTHWDLTNGRRYNGIDIQDAMRLKIKVSASIGYDMKFMLVLSDRNPVCCHLEEIDRRCGIERKHVRSHRGGEMRIDLIEPKYDVYRVPR